MVNVLAIQQQQQQQQQPRHTQRHHSLLWQQQEKGNERLGRFRPTVVHAVLGFFVGRVLIVSMVHLPKNNDRVWSTPSWEQWPPTLQVLRFMDAKGGPQHGTAVPSVIAVGRED
jgi:hypothetical protein